MKGNLLVGAAVGIQDNDVERLQELIKAGSDVIIIDVANGHNQNVIDKLDTYKTLYNKIDYVVGSICN